MPFEPLNTFAIVVAIEHYEMLGPDWNHIRTIGEGIRFVRWLCEEERLPPANIRFFAGERDGDSRRALDELRRDHEVSHEAAKADEIRSSLTDWLCRQLSAAPAGDCAFYFYWSGHGVSDSRVHHGLVCSEMKAGTDPRVFSLEAIRATLRQEGWKRLRRQAFFVDACASRSPRQLLPVDLPDDPGLLARQAPMQFAACSAPPQTTVSATGRFSSILLDVLRASRQEEGMPDMDYAAALLWHRYRRLRNDGQLQTDPWPHLDLLGWNGASFPLSTIEDDGEDARLRRWKRDAIGLAAKLDQPGLFEHYLDCEGRGEDPYLSLPAMAEDLGELTPRRGVPRILEWLARIGAGLEAGHPINQWLEETFDRDGLGVFRLGELRGRLKPPARPFHLFIEIPDKRSCQLRCRVFDNDGRLMPGTDPSAEIEPSRQTIRELTDRVLKDPAMTRYLTDLHVELFVPRELLHLDADQWLDPNDDYDSTLGANYRVALRWIERARGDAALPAQRWGELTEAIFGGTGATIDWTEKEHGTGKFRFLEMKERLAFFTGFCFHPFNADGSPDGMLDKALNQGMPFALWIREPRSDWADVCAWIEAVVAARDRRQTPADLRRYRGASDSCGLGVLWDDPARNPFHFDPKTGRAFAGGRVMFSDVS